MSKRCLLYVAASIVLIASPAWAIPILPTQSALAAAEPDPIGGLVVAGPLVSPLLGAAFTASVTSTVIQGDTSNPYGGLTFVYEISNQAVSVDAIGRFTANGYTGWRTDMSFQPGAGTAPATMDRSNNSNVVGFSFVKPPMGPAALEPGRTSMLLVVQTDAPRFTQSIGNVIDGSIAAGPIYSPIPEPATLLLLVGGLGLLVRRH